MYKGPHRVLKDVKFTNARRGHSVDTNPSNTGVHTCKSHDIFSPNYVYFATFL